MKGLILVCLDGDAILLDPRMLRMSLESVRVIMFLSKMTGTVSQIERLSQKKNKKQKQTKKKTSIVKVTE